MALFLISLIIIISMEVPGLIRKQMWRELTVFSGLLSLGILYGIIHIFELQILNPTTITNTVFMPIFKAVEKLLK